MEIDYKEMYEHLKYEPLMPLQDAVSLWKSIKGWIIELEERSKILIKEYYSVGSAMIKAWDECYYYIKEDADIQEFYISDLRDTFFNGSINILEEYEDSL